MFNEADLRTALVILMAMLFFVALSVKSEARIIDLSQVCTEPAENYLILPSYNPLWDVNELQECGSSSHALHPSVIQTDSTYWGYKLWMVYTPICISENDENPHIAVSNDGVNWTTPTWGSDSLQNPIIVSSELMATHLSDTDIFPRGQDRLNIVFRASWELPGLDSHAVYITSSDDGKIWSAPIRIISDGLLGNLSQSAFLSPSVISLDDTLFILFVVEPRATGISLLDSSRVVRYIADDPAGPWSFLDTTLLSSASSLRKIWHIEVIQQTADTVMALLTESPNGALNYGDSAELYLAISLDAGYSWTVADSPVLSWRDDSTSWFGSTVYRSSGVWVDSSKTTMELFYSGKSRPATQGGTGSGWQTGVTTLYLDSDATPNLRTVSLVGEGDQMHVTDHSPTVRWVGSYPCNDSSQPTIEIEIGTDADWTIVEVWNPEPFSWVNDNIKIDELVLADGTHYFLRLRLGSSFGWSQWVTTSFRMNTAPLIPVILSPVDISVRSQFPMLWCQNSIDNENDIIKYSFSLRNDSLFGNSLPLSASRVSEGIDSTYFQLDEPLTENEKYWWKVRASDSYEFSNWSDSVFFFVDEIPEHPTPTEGLNVLSDTATTNIVFDMLPTFTWSASTDPDPLDSVHYKLEIAVDSNFTFVQVVDSLSLLSHSLSDSLTFNTRYWWRVTAIDNTGLSTVSATIPDFWTWTLGDLDQTHEVNVSDLTMLVAYLFQGGPIPQPSFISDIDGNCELNVSDLTYLVAYLFQGGATPAIGCAP